MRRVLFASAIIVAAATLRADQKNLQVLTGFSDLELQRTMNMIRASLGVSCDFCHVVDDKGTWDFANDAKHEKETARDMMQMTEKINHDQFGGRAAISCNTCHRGSTRPVSLVTLPQVPPEMPALKTTRPAVPALDDVVKRFAAAVGDASRLQTGRVLRGTREGSDGRPLPMELQEAGGRVHIAVTMGENKLEQWVDAKGGTSRDARGVHKFAAANFENFRQLTRAFAPVLPSDIPKDARVIGKEKIGEREVVYVSGRLDERTRVRYYFDEGTGLPVRRVVIKDTSIGPVPQQTDFEDYRDTGGTKYPFTVRASFVDPWVSSTRRYTEVELGATLEDSTFTPPAENN